MQSEYRVYLWFFQVIGLLGLLALCLWLSLRPKDPSFTIMEVSVNNAPSDGGGSIYYILEIKNPNKDSSVYYNDILLTVYNGEDIVGNSTFSGFHQGTGKTKTELKRVDPDPKVWRALQKAVMNSTAQLRTVLLGGIRFKTWGIKSKHHGLRLQGIVPIGSDGKISGKKKTIKLRPGSKKLRVKANRFF